MANVNLTPIQPPLKWLEDPELRSNVEALYFAIYQIFQRTGGGTDNIEGLQVQINVNKTDIAILDVRVTANELNIGELQVDVDVLQDEIVDALTGWPAQYIDVGDFSPAFRQSVQSSNYVTI